MMWGEFVRWSRMVLAAWGLFCGLAYSQDVGKETRTERWSLHTQGTIIGQSHGSFRAPYSGLNSLRRTPEADASVTTTLFFGTRVWRGGEFYINPEVSGGRGISGVLGLAGFPNGDITRVTSPTPKIYLARAFVRQTWDLGGDTEAVEGGLNQLAGRRPVHRLSLILGKISLTDMFDNNAYSHDPRIQFMNWSLMDQGTWDYPADTRGYTWAAVVELNQPAWALRFATGMVSKVANGLEFDTHLRRNHGEVLELETRHKLRGQDGKVRLLGYVNHANMGRYRAALRASAGGIPDIVQTQRAGTLKWGLGLNIEQALSRDVGAFLRLGWNDGKTESWMFTEIDRTFHLGFQFNGRSWTRPQDVWGVGLVTNGLSTDHRDYLAAGGSGFIVGDGRLNYKAERVLEAYYALKLQKMLTLTLDYQRAQNPAHNRDRGPVSIWGLRVHWEL